MNEIIIFIILYLFAVFGNISIGKKALFSYILHYIVWLIGVCYIGATYTSNDIRFVYWLGGGLVIELLLTIYIIFGGKIKQDKKEKEIDDNIINKN